MQISDDQLITLERARGDDSGLVLRFDFQATLLSPTAPHAAVTREQLTVHLPEHRWAPLLDQVGSEVGIILRIPSPLTDADRRVLRSAGDGTPSLGQAVDRLRQARAELPDHQWEHCVATCRRVLEILRGLSGAAPTKVMQRQIAEQRTQDQRWALVLHNLYSLTSASHHEDAVAAAFQWTHAEAEAVLAATAALVRRYWRAS